MSEAYAKAGNNLRLFFLVRDPTTQLVDTTFTAGSFTLQIGKELVGNQATTGCTFGVLDSTNNPGVAYIDCSGSTSFASATGNYTIKVYRTSDATQIWTETVRVTSDGTGMGTWGAYSFTPSASNGRVMSGGSPLAGATVRIVRSDGSIYVQHTTDSSGLWTQTFFDSANATFTVNVQKSGYTLGTGTITIVAGVVTGPGADISLTVSSTSNTLVASDLWAYARRMLTDNVGSKSDTLVQEIVDDALAYLAMTKQWPYLLDHDEVALVPAYSTGTVSITNGATAATFSGASLPSWAASGNLYVNGTWAKISTASTTSLVLSESWGESTVSGATYTLAQHEYTLPTNLQRIDKVIFSNNWPYDHEVSAARIDYLRTVWQTGDSFPSCWGIRADKFMVWPYPNAYHSVHLLYYKRPALLVSPGDVLEWDPQQLMVLRRAIDYQCALRGECVAGTIAECRSTLDEAIDTAWEWDKTGTDRGLDDGARMWLGDDLLRGTIS